MANARLVAVCFVPVTLVSVPIACSAGSPRGDALEQTMVPDDQAIPERTTREPPPDIRAWMDRLTVDHRYDPETGFIVAREVIGLPDVIAGGPTVDDAIRASVSDNSLVVVFATADRCAPCQQYKKSALNDPRVIDRLGRPGLVSTHIEVDRDPDIA